MYLFYKGVYFFYLVFVLVDILLEIWCSVLIRMPILKYQMSHLVGKIPYSKLRKTEKLEVDEKKKKIMLAVFQKIYLTAVFFYNIYRIVISS